MELSYLRDFVTLAQVCNYHEAADLLYISQPTLSKHIKALEQELGRDLFMRNSRNVELTSFGRRYLAYAMRIVEIDRECERKLLSEMNEDAPKFSIGLSPAVSPVSLHQFFPMFTKVAPDTKITLVAQEDETLVKMLKADECAMLLVREFHGLNDAAFELIPFFEDSLVAILPPNSPLAKRNSIDVNELSDAAYIHIGQRTIYNDCLGQPPIIVDQCSTAINLVEQGYGISIATKNVAMHYKTDKVVLVDMIPSPHIQIYLAYAKKNVDVPIIRAVVEYLKHRRNGQGK